MTRDEKDQAGLADAVAESIAGDQAVLDLGASAFATAVATDGRIMRVLAEPDGTMSLHIAGRGHPLRFDRFQARALRAAFAELPDATAYVFVRGGGRSA